MRFQSESQLTFLTAFVMASLLGACPAQAQAHPQIHVGTGVAFAFGEMGYGLTFGAGIPVVQFGRHTTVAVGGSAWVTSTNIRSFSFEQRRMIGIGPFIEISVSTVEGRNTAYVQLTSQWVESKVPDFVTVANGSSQSYWPPEDIIGRASAGAVGGEIGIRRRIGSHLRIELSGVAMHQAIFAAREGWLVRYQAGVGIPF